MMGDRSDTKSLAKEFEKMNPVQTLLDARKTLKLSNGEEAALKRINKELRRAIEPFLKTIDSVAIRAKYRAATDSAISTLTEEHRLPARDALERAEVRTAARRAGRPPA
jgi:hypothetical protein